MIKELKEGWSFLSADEMEHYFRNGRSLCGEFLIIGTQDLCEDVREAYACNSCLAKREFETFIQNRVIADVIDERKRQEEKWGQQNHEPYTYLAILIEEVGEYAQAALQTQFGGNNGGLKHMREEAVQMAAVAVAIIECLDRKKWKWPGESNLPKIEIGKEASDGKI